MIWAEIFLNLVFPIRKELDDTGRWGGPGEGEKGKGKGASIEMGNKQ